MTNASKAEAGHSSETTVISGTYKNYVLGVLLASSVLNYVDRQIVNILAEPMRRDLHLADWQLGAITGLSFAVFYSILGIPIARLADRGNRPWIIAASVAVWSAFTLACGATRSFGQLLLARVGVGAGEGGATPPVHSLIAEITTPQNRASALAILSLGVPLGTLIGLSGGGLIGEALGWRAAFAIAALPGLVVSALVVFTIREPRRHNPKLAAQRSLGDTFVELRAQKGFWWITAATAGSAFVINGQAAFYGSLFLAQHGKELTHYAWIAGPLGLVGIGLGVTRGVGGIVGTFAGGEVTDRIVRTDYRRYCTVPTFAALLGAPTCALVLIVPGALPAAILLFAASLLTGMLYGPTYAAVQTLVAPQSRATAAAVLLFITNIVGLGLGPLTVGLLSDAFQTWVPRAQALEYAMLTTCPVLLLSGLCYAMAQRRIARDMTAA
jgi:predicted MFS family arabinose efflux permease